MDEIDYETELTFSGVEYIMSLNVFRVSSFDPL